MVHKTEHYIIGDNVIKYSPIFTPLERELKFSKSPSCLNIGRYTFAGDSMGQSSFKFLRLATKNASFMLYSARPFKVIQGR